MAVNYFYDGKFDGNVLIVGQTGCRKITFTQNLAKNKMFGEIRNVFWLTKISLSGTPYKISLCFHNVSVTFLYPQTLIF